MAGRRFQVGRHGMGQFPDECHAGNAAFDTLQYCNITDDSGILKEGERKGGRRTKVIVIG